MKRSTPFFPGEDGPFNLQKNFPVRTDEGHLALHEAALGGHLSVVRLLASQPGMLEAHEFFL